MSALPRDVIEHHIWANDRLLAFCETLTDDQLALTVPGTYGPVHKTLVHLGEAEQIYLSRIPDTGITRTLDDEELPLAPVSEIRAALRQTGEAWRAVIERWPDDHPIRYQTREGDREHRSVSFSVVQMLDHGSEHRNHIRTTVSTHGIEPPEIDGWTWDDVRRR